MHNWRSKVERISHLDVARPSIVCFTKLQSSISSPNWSVCLDSNSKGRWHSTRGWIELPRQKPNSPLLASISILMQYDFKNKQWWWQTQFNRQLVCWVERILWLDKHFYTRFWDKFLAISIWKIWWTESWSRTSLDSLQEWSTIWHISSKCKSKWISRTRWICCWKVQILQVASDGSRWY